MPRTGGEATTRHVVGKVWVLSYMEVSSVPANNNEDVVIFL